MTATRQSRRKSAAQWQKDCDAWNAANPVGTAVMLKKDGGETVSTKTRSEAYVSDAGYGVIFLEGVTGYYLLDRVTVKRTPAEENAQEFYADRHHGGVTP